MQVRPEKIRWPARIPMALGLIAMMALIAILGVWGTQTKLSGAIIAPGTLVVESNRQVIQHEEGGIITDILARDGDRVSAGDVVLKLDDTFLNSELLNIEQQYFEFLARQGRLQAEQGGSNEIGQIQFPLKTVLSAEQIDAILTRQINLFKTRKESFFLELDQLHEKVIQLEIQISGTESELESLNTQDGIISEEISETASLVSQGLSEIRPLRVLQREEAEIEGQKGRLTALIAQFRGQIADVRLQRAGLQAKRRENAISKLEDLSARGGEIAQRRQVLLERLTRLNIRAPVSGRVFGSNITALNTVITPASDLLFIIPNNSPLIIRARIPTVDVDNVTKGQAVALRFSALDLRHTPEIRGFVHDVAADATEDPSTGIIFYEATIIPDNAELSQLSGQELRVGMPAEVLIQTAERTPLNYFVKPLADYFNAALKEN